MLANVNKNSFNGVFFKTFRILIIAEIVPIIIASFLAYRQTIKILETYIPTTTMDMLYQTDTTTDLMFNQMEQIIKQLSMEPDIINTIVDPDINSFTKTNKSKCSKQVCTTMVPDISRNFI